MCSLVRSEMLDITRRPHQCRVTSDGGEADEPRVTSGAAGASRVGAPSPGPGHRRAVPLGERVFLAADKYQVKYEMLRAVAVDGVTVVAAAAAHGYSRGEYYLVAKAFSERGMAGWPTSGEGAKGRRS